jgi:putative transposase
MSKIKKQMGVQQMLLHPDRSTKAILQYLCEQSGKLYNSGLYFARQMLFKTGKLLASKFDLDFEPTVAKSLVAKSLPSTPTQQTLRSVVEAFKSFRELRTMHQNGELAFRPQSPQYLQGAKLFKIAYPNSGGQRPKVVDGKLRFALGLTVNK